MGATATTPVMAVGTVSKPSDAGRSATMSATTSASPRSLSPLEAVEIATAHAPAAQSISTASSDRTDATSASNMIPNQQYAHAIHLFHGQRGQFYFYWIVYLLFNIIFRYWPVNDFATLATSSGVPSATTTPPPSPPSGPISII